MRTEVCPVWSLPILVMYMSLSDTQQPVCVSHAGVLINNPLVRCVKYFSLGDCMNIHGLLFVNNVHSEWLFEMLNQGIVKY